MSNITQLQHCEAVQVDHDRLGELYLQLGEHSAEDVVCRAMEEVSMRMTHCERYYRKGDMTNLRKSVRSMIAIGEQIGMLAVARVAQDVVVCIDRADPIALGATLARLMRAGEGSLSAVWDLQDITV
ncbi:MAG: hypothetical protein AAF218_09705 [Pseudomonadota bacterium]